MNRKSNKSLCIGVATGNGCNNVGECQFSHNPELAICKRICIYKDSCENDHCLFTHPRDLNDNDGRKEKQHHRVNKPCNNGDECQRRDCKFTHPRDRENNSDSDDDGKEEQPMLCRYGANCNGQGKGCDRFHPGGNPHGQRQPYLKQNKAAKQVCWNNHKQGGCQNENCKFEHPKEQDVDPSVLDRLAALELGQKRQARAHNNFVKQTHQNFGGVQRAFADVRNEAQQTRQLVDETAKLAVTMQQQAAGLMALMNKQPQRNQRQLTYRNNQ